MLVPLAPYGCGNYRRCLFGLTLVVSTSFAAHDGFAVDAKPVIIAATKTEGKDSKEKTDSKDSKEKTDSKDSKEKTDSKDQAKPADVVNQGAGKAGPAATVTETAGQEKGKGTDELDFSLNAPIDPIPALGDGFDDFQDIDKRASQYAKDGAVESEDARIERELKAYKEAEAKAENEKAQQEAKAREEARLNAREEEEKAAHRNKTIESDADKKARELKGIDKDELTWKGLED